MPDLNNVLSFNQGPNDPLVTGGQPPHDGGMEARVAKLEAHVEHIREDVSAIKQDLRGFRDEAGKKVDGLRDRMERDFRLTFGAIITAILSLAAVMAKGFGWL